mmetsp:Transcript_147223/g.382725  ORF Transcript_147223/g.382725 Transcript_147223/m.382725 type:complete len:258 (+) Transcript_147223:303-1076(+)
MVHAPGAASRVGGPDQSRGRYPWAVPRPLAALRIRWLSAGGQLPLPRGLRGQRESVIGGDHSALSVQVQVSGELLHAQRKPRVRSDHTHLRLLRRVQAALQHQALEAVLRRLQLLAGLWPRGREDHLHARWSLARDQQHGPDQAPGPPHRRARHGHHLRFAVGGPREGHRRLGRERPRRLVYLRSGCGVELPREAGHGLGLSRPPGRRGRLRVLRQTPAHHHLQRTQLLRRVRQRRCNDDDRRDADVQLQGAQACEG